MRQVGESAAAMSSSMIAFHTGASLYQRRISDERVLVPTIIITMVWIYLIVFTIASVREHPGSENAFEAPTPYWCSISKYHIIERILGIYIWFWIEVVATAAVYLFVFLILRSNLVPKQPSGWSLCFSEKARKEAASRCPPHSYPKRVWRATLAYAKSSTLTSMPSL
jgi:hypothetical protein